jgi:hypothetical protein
MTEQEFILGYVQEKDALVLFESTELADFEADDWVIVRANTLVEAKDLYEETFLAWQKRQ